jgi:hypothetical protein
MKSKIQTISLFVLIGFFCSLFYHYYFSQYLNYQYPYTTFLFRPGDVFRDYLVQYSQSISLDPYGNNAIPGLPANYFPYAYIFIYPLTVFDYDVSSKLFFLISILLCLIMMYDFLKKFQFWDNKFDLLLPLVILVFFSYPILFCLDRLNIEIVPLFFSYIYLKRISEDKYKSAFIYIAIAALIKPYYIIFIIAGLGQDFYKRTFYFIILFIFIALISFIIMKRPIFENILLLYQGLLKSGGILTLTQPLFFSASLLEPIRYFSGLIFSDANPNLLNIINNIYFFNCVVFSIAVLYVSFSTKFLLWEKIYACAAFVIICSHVSFDYKLVLIYLPMMAFISEIEKKSFKNIIFCIIFSAIIIPKDYYYFSHGIDTSISVILNPLILVSGLIFIFLFKFSYCKFNKNREIKDES